MVEIKYAGKISLFPKKISTTLTK